jgi:midasin (ATPase involved in ribosome maturation)
LQIEDLFGTYIPVEKDGEIKFVFQEGKLLEAIANSKNRKKEVVILFD